MIIIEINRICHENSSHIRNKYMKLSRLNKEDIRHTLCITIVYNKLKRFIFIKIEKKHLSFIILANCKIFIHCKILDLKVFQGFQLRNIQM